MSSALVAGQDETSEETGGGIRSQSDKRRAWRGPGSWIACRPERLAVGVAVQSQVVQGAWGEIVDRQQYIVDRADRVFSVQEHLICQVKSVWFYNLATGFLHYLTSNRHSNRLTVTLGPDSCQPACGCIADCSHCFNYAQRYVCTASIFWLNKTQKILVKQGLLMGNSMTPHRLLCEQATGWSMCRQRMKRAHANAEWGWCHATGSKF